MDTLIIGIGHRARQGKDTAARVIHEAFPRETKLYGFADALYALCRIQGMRGKDGRRLQDVGETFRTPGAIDVAGVEVRTHRNFWVEVLLDRIATDRPAVALITDMRHTTEAAICEVRIKVERVDAEGRPWLATDRDPHHVSETALADYKGWTHVLRNVDGDQIGFEEQAVDLGRRIIVAAEAERQIGRQIAKTLGNEACRPASQASQTGSIPVARSSLFPE